MSPLQLLVGAIQATSAGGLIRVEIVLNGEDFYALVDSGASHNFMAGRLATTLKLYVEPCQNRIKAVNSAFQGVLGLASEVDVAVGP